MDTKILILTAGYGEGHNTAARNIAGAIDVISHGEIRPQLLDLFDTCYGGWNKIVQRAYIGAINRTPKLWQKIYDALDSTQLFEQSLGSLAKVRSRLEEMLKHAQPGAVVSTYPVYNYLINEIYEDARRRPFAQITMVTDSITINSIWHRCASDVFIVANHESAEVMRRGGVPSQRIKVLGFPIAHRFFTASLPRKAPSEADGRRVLFMINEGMTEALEKTRALLKIRDISLTITAGRDEKMRLELEQAARDIGREVEIHGWTDKMPELLMTHHLVIGKAGGATVQETIAAKTPMIINRVVPGQEEGNARLLLENDCGALARSPEAIVGAVNEAFRDSAKRWHRWFDNISKLSRPDAALVIARYVLDACKIRRA